MSGDGTTYGGLFYVWFILVVEKSESDFPCVLHVYGV